MIKMRSVVMISVMTGFSVFAEAQLYISESSPLYIQPGASIHVQGDITANSDVLGEGKIVMNGSGPQVINMNGKTIPNLEISNSNNISLNGDMIISNSLLFTDGKIRTGNYNLQFSATATISGQGTDKFIETNGTGRLQKAVASNLVRYEMPVGNGSAYRPVFISTNGTYSSALVSVQSKGTAHPDKPFKSSDFLNCYWPVTQTGITGTVRATGNYVTDFTGTESNLRGFTYLGGEWSRSDANIDVAQDTAGAIIPAGGADLYAMNRFIYLKNKVFLQGAYNSATGLMNDNLRTLASFPTTDPYRSAPYNAYFTHHVSNTEVETISSPVTVLGAQASAADQIVDWIFIELRNATVSPGNTILQTRSALLQRDGDVVDVDGVSPVYFKNLDPDNYSIAIRHRNHLGLSTDPATWVHALTEKSTTPLVDMTTATDAQLFGSANVNYSVVSGKNLLYAGNVSGNGVVRYQGTNGPGATNISDRVALLSDLGNNELNTISTYQRGDVTMNGVTRYQGTNGPGANNVSDRVFILGTVLGNNEIQTKTQALPN